MKKLASILIAVAIVFGFVALPFMESNAAEVVKEDSFDEIVSVLHFADMFTSGHPDWSLEFTMEELEGPTACVPGAFVYSFAYLEKCASGTWDKYLEDEYIYHIPFDEYMEYANSRFYKVIPERMKEFLTGTNSLGLYSYDVKTDIVTIKAAGGLGAPSKTSVVGIEKNENSYTVYLERYNYEYEEVEARSILTVAGTKDGLKIAGYQKVESFTINNPYKPTDTVVGLDNGEDWAKITVNGSNATVKFDSKYTVEGLEGYWYQAGAIEIPIYVTVADGYKLVSMTSDRGTILYSVHGQPVIVLGDSAFGPITVTVETEKIQATVEVPVTEETTKNLQAEIDNVVADIAANKDVSDVVDEATKSAIQNAIQAQQEISVKPVSDSMTINNVEKKDAEEVTKLVTEKGKVAQYLDLKVVVLADGEEIGTLNKLSKPLTFEIEIDKDLIVDGREFYVVRVHDGKAEKLTLTHVKDNKYSFESDLFSTYALAYEDVVAPKTGDVTSFAWVLVAVAAMSVIVVVGNKRKYF